MFRSRLQQVLCIKMSLISKPTSPSEIKEGRKVQRSTLFFFFFWKVGPSVKLWTLLEKKKCLLIRSAASPLWLRNWFWFCGLFFEMWLQCYSDFNEGLSQSCDWSVACFAHRGIQSAKIVRRLRPSGQQFCLCTPDSPITMYVVTYKKKQTTLLTNFLQFFQINPAVLQSWGVPKCFFFFFCTWPAPRNRISSWAVQ